MTAKYAHLDNDPVRLAVNQIGDTLSANLNRRPGAEILHMRRGRGVLKDG